MSNPYVLDRKNNITQNYHPSFPVDPNTHFSAYQRETHTVGEALYRQTTIGKLLVDALARAVIGKGLTPMSSPEKAILGWSDERVTKFTEQTEAYWRLITNDTDFDYYGKDTFLQLQKIAFTGCCVTGDALRHNGYRKLKNGKVVPYLQVISGRMVTQNHETDTLSSTGGVIIDPETGRETGYKIRVLTDDRTDTMVTKTVHKYNRFGRKEFDLIVLQKSDPSLVRGIPLLTTLRDDILNTNAFKDNYILQSAIQNLFTAFIEREAESEQSTMSTFDKISQAAEEVNNEERNLELGTGIIVDLEPGEHANVAQRQPHGGEYDQFMKSTIGLDASAIGMSYETATNEYNASFSASRAGINATERNYEIYRQEFATKFCTPTWNQVIEYGILNGDIDVPEWEEFSPLERKAVLAVTWAGVAAPQVDPVKEVRAYIEAINANLCTREYAVRQLYGSDYEETVDRLKLEANLLGISLNGESDSSETNGEGKEDEDGKDE